MCIVLLYDICSEKSFKLVAENMLPKVKTFINPTYQFIMLLGNKLDLEDTDRKVEFERVSDFA